MHKDLIDPAARAELYVHNSGDRMEIRGTSVHVVVNAALALGGITVIAAHPPEVAHLIQEGLEISQNMNM